MSERLLVRGGTVVTLGEPNRVLPGHDVLCEGGLVARVAPSADLPEEGVRVVDARGKVVLPGFVNVHMHFYSTMVRGLGKAAPSKDFDEVLKNLWWRLDRKLTVEDCRYSALVPLIEAVRHGTTTLIDHHASPFAARGSLAAIADAVTQVGLRASLCYEVSDRDGEKVAQDGLDENVDWLKACAAEGGNRLKGLFGLHAAFTIGDATLAKAAELGRSLGAGFHVHVAEARSDQEHSVATHGKRVVERLHEHGILGPRTIAAHCVHVDARERALLARTGTAVAHNPQSNLNNAVGVADLPALARDGVLLGLGTDAMTVNMLEEVRAALFAQHLGRENPSAAWGEVTTALLRGNAAIANRYFDPPVGEVREGFCADLALVDYHPPTPFDEATFQGHLLFGLSQSTVDTTIAGGRVLMEGKRLLLDLDEAEVAARSRELASRLWERF